MPTIEEDLLLNRKQCKLFINLQGKTMQRVANITNLTYCHALRLTRLFEKKGWVIIEKKGRDLNISYTSKGEEIYNKLIDLMGLV